MRFIPIFLFYLIAILGSSSWGACYYTSSTRIFNLDYITSGAPSCFECPSVYRASSTAFFYNPKSRLGVGQVDFSPCEQTAVDDYCSSGGYICNCGNAVLCSRQCYYNHYCTTQKEADSLSCEIQGGDWNGTECRQCGQYSCKTITAHSTLKTDNQSVSCLGNSCNNYNCKVFSKLQEICVNGCGDSTISTIATDTTYYEDSACDPQRYFEDCSVTNFCYEIGGKYILYKKCLNGQVFNGVEGQTTKIVASGKGSCADQGYLSQNPEQNTPQDSMSIGGNGSDSLPDYCLLFGVGCPAAADSSGVNYSSSSERNEQNGCICRPYDGLDYFSIVTCPDGSSSTFYGSCDEWKKPPTSSSSSLSQSSSSTADTTGTSGGTSSGNTPTDWANWSQMREQIILQATTNYKLDQVNMNLNKLNNGINELNTSLNSSVPMPDLDTTTASFPGVNFQDTLTAILGYMPTKNTILDTLDRQDISNGTCPELYIFKNDIKILSLKIPATKLNLADIGGFNLCKISRAILVLFAEIVSSLLVIGLFRKFSG